MTFRRSVQFILLLVLIVGLNAIQAQQPGIDCVPIQGQGWQGCQPINNGTQQQQRPQAPPMHWEERWGAIAIDTNVGALGTSHNMISKYQAEEAALSDCQSKGGNRCRIDLSYGNGCAAMIVGNNGKIFNTNSDETINKAAKKGLKTCSSAANDCHIYYSSCSLPVLVK